MNISDSLEQTSVSDLDLSRYVSVDASASVAETVKTMSDARRSAAFVEEGDRLVGIFTQRDVLQRVIGRPRIWPAPVTEEMTRNLRTMRDTQSVSDGLTLMNEWWIRSVPVLDVSDGVVGNLSFYAVMQHIADMLVRMLPDDSVQAGLRFVDFTGLNTSAPVVVSSHDTVEVAAHQMKARGIGSVMVVDDRDNLVGVLTEFDLQQKIGCDRADLDAIFVADYMTADPVALQARAPISDAVQNMAKYGFSHVPLLGESGRPVGVASFRDIATYVETSLATV